MLKITYDQLELLVNRNNLFAFISLVNFPQKGGYIFHEAVNNQLTMKL